MVYRQCSHCGGVTDGDESKCPTCEKNPLGGTMTTEELISRIKNGEIALSQIWTKWPNKIPQALESLPR